jgi:hypothetical protein
VATFGYGLSMVGDDYGRQLAAIIETPQRQIHSLIRAGTPPNLKSLLAHDKIFFWGDLDLEGLRIYQRLKDRLPKLELSAMYQPMIEMMYKPGATHPYLKAVGKEGQGARHGNNNLINKPQDNVSHYEGFIDTSSGAEVLDEIAQLCTSSGIDQEILSKEQIIEHCIDALVDAVTESK